MRVHCGTVCVCVCGVVWCGVPRGSLWLAPYIHTRRPRSLAPAPQPPSHRFLPAHAASTDTRISSRMIITLHPSGTQHHGRIYPSDSPS
jgi:hypothetical protein